MKIAPFLGGIMFLTFSITTLAADYTLFWVANFTQNPKGLCVAEFEINEEGGGVCSRGAGNYCSTEKLITLKNIPNQKFTFTLTKYKCLTSSEQFNNIDASCRNRNIEIQPHLTTINIEGDPSNILTTDTRIICKVKDYQTRLSSPSQSE